MDLSELVSAVYELDDTEDISKVFNACNERHKQIRQQVAAKIGATLNTGDRVRISQDVRPKRYAGATGKVVGKRSTRWTIMLDSGEHLVVGASAIRPEEAE